jgi:hypothetical protein
VLKQPETKLAAQAGAQRNTISVLWDSSSFKRYRVSTDDNIFWLKDIAEHADTYQSIFENPYLRFWHDIHNKIRREDSPQHLLRNERLQLIPNASQVPLRMAAQRGLDALELSRASQ